jgi:hypothetical protein
LIGERHFVDPELARAAAGTGAISVVRPPGARCAPRGGVLVSTVSMRQRIATGW